MRKLNVQLIRLKLGYDQKVVVSCPDLELLPGQIYCVFGRNGSGKTTFLKSLAALLPLIHGSISIGEENVHEMSAGRRSKELGVVLTKMPFIGTMRIYDFVSFGRYPYTNWLGKIRDEDEAVISRTLEMAGLIDIKEKHLSEISDGEMQKVQIARSLVQETRVMLLDEPASHLDLVNKAEVFSLLSKIRRSGDKVIVFTSHDVQFAMQLADHFLVVENGIITPFSKENFKTEKVYERVLKSELMQIDPANNSVLFREED